jgi:Ca2+-binding EF-hand superfamily protein
VRRGARWLTLVVLLALSVPAPAAPPLELPDYVFVVAPEEENLDVVVFGATRPALIQFRVQIHGRGFRTAWDEFAGRLHDYLDSNDDHILTVREAQRGGWQQIFRDQLPFRNSVAATPAGDPAAFDTEPKDGRLSVPELSRYLREAVGHDALGVQPGLGPDPKTQAAFVQLDLDGDGVLAPAELAAADGLIRRLDNDEDEMVTLAELRPNDNPYADQFGMVDPRAGSAPVAAESDPLVPLTSAEARQRVARRLVTRYHGGFPQADSNGDGAVDASELERFLTHPSPSLVLVVRLGPGPQHNSTIELAGPVDSPGPLAASVKKSDEDGLVLDLEGVEIPLGLNDAVGDYRRFFDMRFNEADADKDGALDKKEVEKSRFFGTLFDAADRNGDAKLSKSELTAYLDRSVDATECRLMLTAADSGRSIFEVLDADRDQRLSRRELREASKRLKAYDRDGDGQVGLAELPTTYQLSVGRGPFSGRRGVAFETYDSPPRRPSGSRGDAVSWFRHMDRNQDGDVSIREFLGTADQFRKLDADGDGLIDAKEAAKGP